MTTKTTYVYGPFSNTGSVTGRIYYCMDPDSCTGTGNQHFPCGSGWITSSAVDISQTGSIYLRATNVMSIRTYIQSTCCGGSCPSNFSRLVKVVLYGKENGGCYMGSVGSGHIKSPQVADGTLYNYSNSILIGTANNDDGGCGEGCCSGCSSGIHAHMQMMGGTVVAQCYNDSVTS